MSLTPTTAGVRRSDPVTSHEAADRVGASKLEAWVYAYLRSVWPRHLTSTEIAVAMGLHVWSVSPRMQPLVRKGFVEEPIVLKGRNSVGKMRNMYHWRAIKRVDE